MDEVRRILESAERPTALFCASDRLAASTLQVATRLDIRVPDELSLVGYNGDAWAELLPVERNLGFAGGNNVALRPVLAGPKPPDHVLLLNPDTVVDTHAHSFAVQALVVQGEMWLTVGSRTQHLKAGERFELEPDVPHAERYGREGATYWVARRNKKT